MSRTVFEMLSNRRATEKNVDHYLFQMVWSQQVAMQASSEGVVPGVQNFRGYCQ